MTQTERVIRALERSGERGISSVDFLLPDVVDGGKPITRLAARILDARGQGHHIVTDGERHGCAVYRLAEPGQGTARTGSATPPANPMGLDDPPAGVAGQLFSTSSPYQEEAA